MGSIAILGPGGVGGFLAGALAHAGAPVVVVARESTAEQIARAGIEVESIRLGDFTTHPRAMSVLSRPAEVLIVATKATTLEEALERVETDPGLVVPVLNGLEHMHVLRRRFGEGRVAAGVIRVESTAPAPGRVRQTSPFLRVDLASEDPRLRPALTRLAACLEAAEVPVRIETSEAQVLWSKLVRLVALATTTSASGRTIGFIRSDPEWGEILQASIQEAAAVANAEGADIDPAATWVELQEAHPELGSSMQRDLAAGRVPELDAIAGSVLREGRRHGLECPTIARLSRCIAGRAGLTPISA